jgi:hypothetical protein
MQDCRSALGVAHRWWPAALRPEVDAPADGVPSFILHGGHFGAPERIKMTTFRGGRFAW